MSIGQYPSVGLAEARLIRENAKKSLREGRDPGSLLRLAKIANEQAAANTFAAVASEYRQKLVSEGKSPATLTKIDWIIDDLLGPSIGSRPIAEIKAAEVLAALRQIESRKHFETATRARRVCGQIFRFAVATGRAEYDITHSLKGALTTPKTTHRAAILDKEKFATLLRDIDEYNGSISTKYAMRVLPYLFVRPAELRNMLWAELDFDDGLWRIPAAKLKMRRDHIVPLAKQVVEILKELNGLTGYSKFVFPSAWQSDRPLSENTLNTSLRRLGYDKSEMTSHGFRRTASTFLNEAGFNRDWIERQLAHVDGRSVRGIYNAAEYLDGRREMMQWWADQIGKMKTPLPGVETRRGVGNKTNLVA